MEDTNKKGTLELLCGPSGVGKSFSIPEGNKSYRWTTRPKREGEIDSRIYSGRTTDGFFMAEEEFIGKKEELVGIHKYPDHNTNYYYGFPKRDIIKAIDEEKTINIFKTAFTDLIESNKESNLMYYFIDYLDIFSD